MIACKPLDLVAERTGMQSRNSLMEPTASTCFNMWASTVSRVIRLVWPPQCHSCWHLTQAAQDANASRIVSSSTIDSRYHSISLHVIEISIQSIHKWFRCLTRSHAVFCWEAVKHYHCHQGTEGFHCFCTGAIDLRHHQLNILGFNALLVHFALLPGSQHGSHENTQLKTKRSSTSSTFGFSGS